METVLIAFGILVLVGLLRKRQQPLYTQQLAMTISANHQTIHANQKTITALENIVKLQHEMINNYREDRKLTTEKINEIANLLPTETEQHWKPTEGKSAAIVMFQKMEDVRKLVKQKYPLLAEEIEEILK